MPRAVWSLVGGRPVVQIELHAPEGRTETRTLLADTGAGALRSKFELVLREEDCELCGGRPSQAVNLRGAYDGAHWVYLVHVRIPIIGQNLHVRAVGAKAAPPGLDGIACYRFLSNFTFENFGVREQFGIETR